MSGTADPSDPQPSNPKTNQSFSGRESQIEKPKSNRPSKKSEKEGKKKKSSGKPTSAKTEGEGSSTDSEANKLDPQMRRALLESTAENKRLQARLLELENFQNSAKGARYARSSFSGGAPVAYKFDLRAAGCIGKRPRQCNVLARQARSGKHPIRHHLGPDTRFHEHERRLGKFG